MQALTPLPITNFSINVLENDYPVFVEGTTYSAGTKVIKPLEHAIYEYLEGGMWKYISKTNAHKWTDDKSSTQTVQEGNITIELDTTEATAVSLLNIECENLKIEILDGAEIIFTKEYVGLERDVFDWWDFFFKPFNYQRNFFTTHPYNPYARYRITLTGDVCKIGMLIPGILEDVGYLVANPKPTFGFIDYSKYIDDDYGGTTIAQGAFRNTFKGEILIPAEQFFKVSDLFRARRGTLTLYLQPSLGLYLMGFVKEPEVPTPQEGEDYISVSLDIKTIN